MTAKPTLAAVLSTDVNEKAGNKTAFHRKARASLQRLAGELGLEKANYDLRTNKGGPAVSGEVILHADRFYLEVSQSVDTDDVLFRRCKDRTDKTGGENRWAKAEELDDPTEFAKRLNRELHLGGEETEDAPVETERKDIPLGKLRPSPKNVRIVAADEDADRQLAANIKRRGLLQNLIVCEASDGLYEVAGGGRRLAALKSLDLPDDRPIPCLVAPEVLAVELSTAENLRRSSMHPADEAAAFRVMVHEQGREIDDVAAEFGFSARLVQQRLKLASLAGELIEKFRGGEIKLEWAMALTVTDRHEDQKNAWQQVAHLSEWQDLAATIRRILSQEKVAGDMPLAVFVGLDAYKAAGGGVDEDLFSSPDDIGSVFLTDAPLLKRLAHEKLEEAAAKLRDQWLWAEARVEFAERETWTSFRQNHGELPVLPDDLAQEDRQVEQRLDELYELDRLDEEQVAEVNALDARRVQIEQWPVANARFSDELRQRAGCVATVDRDGNLQIHQGLMRPEDQPGENAGVSVPKVGGTSTCEQLANPDLDARSLSDDVSLASEVVTDVSDGPSFKVSDVLGRDLGAYRTLCLQAALAQDPDLARDLLLHILTKDVLHLGYWTKPSEISARPAHLVSSQNDLDNQSAADEISSIRGRLPLSFNTFPDEERPAKLRDMLPEDKDTLLAFCVASSLTQCATRPDEPRNKMLDFIQGELGGNQVISSRWRPTAANFFGRIKGADALAIGRDILGEDWARRHRNDKKGPLSQALEKAFAAGDELIDNVTPEARARAATWLPPGMGFGGSLVEESQTDGDETADDIPDFLSGEEEEADAEAA